MTIPVLSAFYFGSVAHYRLLASVPKVIIDIGEHYERQSFRNRTSILGPNGRQDLVVQIRRRSGDKMPMGSVGVSYAETWPQQHMHAIRTAYGNAPWSIHYLDAIEEVITRRYERLVDLDLATMRLGLAWLGLKTEVEVSEQYIKVASPESEVASPETEGLGPESAVGSQETIGTVSRLETQDYRTVIHPKRPIPPDLQSPSYPQVFSERHGFQAGLSFIDLVCNCGPEARSMLFDTASG